MRHRCNVTSKKFPPSNTRRAVDGKAPIAVHVGLKLSQTDGVPACFPETDWLLGFTEAA
jgi:hypothetical protein